MSLRDNSDIQSGLFVPGLLQILELLEPYLDILVLAGGWVPFIYHSHLGKSASDRAPLTRDVDIVTPKKIPIRGDSIDKVLQEAGLDCEFRSISEPPVTAYVGHLGEDEVEIEFLTHAPGDKEDIVEVQRGLTAQSLHHIILLYENKWTVEIDRLSNTGPPMVVHVPKPAAFVVHKGIVYRKRRDKLKRAKDLFYLFHVLAVYSREWNDWIIADLAELARRHPAWLRKMVNNLESDFSLISSPAVKAVVDQRPPAFLIDLNDEQLAQYLFDVISKTVHMITDLLE